MGAVPTPGATGWRSAAILVAALGLAGCEGGVLPRGEAEPVAVTPSGGGADLPAEDVEAPEIFQVTEPGLWDGRPSLGGVWVAHPDVTEPERVVIRNPATNVSVVGALFRRERDNPGPALQVSSDAAEALGMLAGAPTTLSVTALRRETQAAPSEAVSTVTGTIAAPEVIATAPLDPAAAPPLDASAPSTPVTPAGASLDRPFVQIGIFSMEANAEDIRAQIESQGMPARVLAQESQGRQFWRVLVGPAASEAERADLLERVRGQGFADAYFVRS